MKTGVFLFFIEIIGTLSRIFAIIGPPTRCHGPVPKISEGKYYYHDNGTYLLRISTNIGLNLDLHEVSCFQIDVEETGETNETSRLTSLFYAVRYAAYAQSYDVRQSYTFGVAELQSHCKCNCPKTEEFCTSDYDKKDCSKSAICITRFHAFQDSHGCPKGGSANLCCEITVKPYKNRRFVAINLVDPRPRAEIEIEIFAQYESKWSLFRRYKRSIVPYRTNSLRLNGYENVAEMYVRATTETPRFYLKNGDKFYFYEDIPKFRLIDDVRINSLFERDPSKFGWLRYENGEWNVGDPTVSLHDLQRPLVVNCKDQKYTDAYDIDFSNVIVIRNTTGSISGEPYIGAEVSKKQSFVDTVRLSSAIVHGDSTDSSLTVTFKQSAAPSLKLDIDLHQKMSVIAHLYSSYLEDFGAEICLDKRSNRYLNVTLIKSYGQFHIEVFKDMAKSDMELVLSMTTNLPFATNYSEILPLPNFVASSRLVCVFAHRKPSNRLCKWASFVKEPHETFVLQNPFIKTEGKCPGCNKDISGGFLSNFYPGNWLDGISSFSEGVAFAIELIMYVILFVIIIALWRKCLYPLVKWALCSKVSVKAYEITPRTDKGAIV